MKPARHIINLLIVWSLTGLWHGASWNFVAWGLYYGILLILEKYIFKEKIKAMPVSLQHLYTLLIVVIGWVFFSAESLGIAVDILKSMFGLGGISFVNSQFMYILKNNIVLLIAGFILSGPKTFETFSEISKKHSFVSMITLLTIFVISVSYLIFSSYNPFLYFRF